MRQEAESLFPRLDNIEVAKNENGFAVTRNVKTIMAKYREKKFRLEVEDKEIEN